MIRSDRHSALPLALLSASLVLLLGACAPKSESSPVAEPAASADTAATPVAEPAATGDAGEAPRICSADAVQALVGQEATEAVVAQATADSGSASVRVLKPGQAATMDFRQDRLNILTDDAGVIEQLSCG